MNSFEKYLSISVEHISSDLLNNCSKEKLMLLSSHLPDVFARFLFGYEKCLTDTDSKMDISLSASNKDVQYNFSSIFDYPEMDHLVTSDERWSRIRNFAYAWHDEYNILNKIDFVALEFDFPIINHTSLIPSVFLGIKRIPVWKSPFYTEEIYQRHMAFISGLEILLGHRIDPDLENSLKDVTDKSLNRFHIFQAGAMLSRNSGSVRICLRRFNSEDILKRISGLIQDPVLSEELRFITEKYCIYFDELVLALDVSADGIKRAAVECYYKHKMQPDREKRWIDIFSQLVNDDLCEKETAESVLQFPRRKMIFSNNGNKPEYYAQGLHHLKFTAGAGRETFAKVYLWSGFHWNNY